MRLMLWLPPLLTPLTDLMIDDDLVRWHAERLTDEPTTSPVQDDDNQPAKKGELRQTERNLRTEIEGVLALDASIEIPGGVLPKLDSCHSRST